MRELDSPVYVEIPQTWTGTKFRGEKLPSTGYATYYTQIIVDKNISNLALNGKVQSTNYKLFVNGEEIGEVGKLGNL